MTAGFRNKTLSLRAATAGTSVVWMAAQAALALGGPPAFPGAVGQGAASLGGRGGDVYHVTNLQDYDSNSDEPKIPGTLRHAIRSAEGPRTIAFDVAGAIKLRGRLELLKDRITIVGQTSPGGITLWGFPFEISRASDVVVRHLRFRLGDFHLERPDGSRLDASTDLQPLSPSTANAVDVGRSERVILDHVSACWGVDETLSITKSRDVTVQHAVIAESLNHSFHPKGSHGYGSLLRGELTSEDRRDGTGGYTMFGNLWAHHRARNPSIGGQQSLTAGQSESDRRGTDVNMVNNVVYDWDDQPTHRSAMGPVRINLVGNYFVNGPAGDNSCIFKENNAAPTEVYHRCNFRDDDQDADHDGQAVPQDERTFCNFDDGDLLRGGETPFLFYRALEACCESAPRAYDTVVRQVGASLWRDAIDRRIVQSLVDRTGKLIDSQEEFRSAEGQLPGIDDATVARRPDDFDIDRDGMADEFERANGLNPANPEDRNDHDLSDEGYTNLEVYLDELTGTP